jgi:hypothetical protein
MDKKVTTISGERAPEQASATVTDELARKAAAIMGRKGGLVKSERKTESCRMNARMPRSDAGRVRWIEDTMREARLQDERKARRKAQRQARRITRAHK